MILATTTSTQDSGLLDVLVPAFEKESGAKVKTVAVGSGQAIEMGRGARPTSCWCTRPRPRRRWWRTARADRRLVMHNDFVIVGPAADPAHIRGAAAEAAMARIAQAKAPFISRGDDSGTHTLELKRCGTGGRRSRRAILVPGVGQGMGATLQIADERTAYTIDRPRRPIWPPSGARDLKLLVEG